MSGESVDELAARRSASAARSEEERSEVELTAYLGDVYVYIPQVPTTIVMTPSEAEAWAAGLVEMARRARGTR